VVAGQQNVVPKVSIWRCSKAELENGHFYTLIRRYLNVLRKGARRF